MKNLPLVSIVIPVYNGDNYIREAIDSALSQTYKNIEIIVVNDGSNDNGNTEKIVKSYGNKVTYFAKENGGVSTALNLGIKKMKGSFFSWLSHDDIYYPNKIETQIDYLLKNNLIGKKVITYTNYDVINEKSKVTNTVRFQVYNPNYYPEYALLRGLISGTALLIPKTAFKDYGLFDENYRCVQDYLLFFEFMKTYKYIFISKVTNATRVHSKQVTCINPKVINENNMLWTKMQKELPKNIKIRLSGSEYKFYREMYKFLIHHNNYIEAQKFALNQQQRFLKIENLKIKKILDELGAEKMFAYIYVGCENANIKLPIKLRKKSSYYGKLANNEKIQYRVNKIINNLEIEDIIHCILNNKIIIKNSILKNYYKLLYNKDYIKKNNVFSRLFLLIKKHGYVKTIKIIKNKIINK